MLTYLLGGSLQIHKSIPSIYIYIYIRYISIYIHVYSFISIYIHAFPPKKNIDILYNYDIIMRYISIGSAYPGSSSGLSNKHFFSQPDAGPELEKIPGFPRLKWQNCAKLVMFHRQIHGKIYGKSIINPSATEMDTFRLFSCILGLLYWRVPSPKKKWPTQAVSIGGVPHLSDRLLNKLVNRSGCNEIARTSWRDS